MKRILLSLSIALALCVPIVTLAAFGLEETASGAGIAQNQDVPTVAGNVIGTALSIIGVLFFILMVYGGLNWMIARGDESLVSKAKDTITAAIIGLIIVLGSFAITNFAFNSTGGSSEQNRIQCKQNCINTISPDDPADLQVCQQKCAN